MQLGGFYELYSINVKRPKRDADSDRGKHQGLNSPHGRRGAICAHFGWTYDYLVNGIAWSLVQRMMLDAPNYDVDANNGNNDEDIVLTKSNSEDIMKYVNNLM